MSVERTRRNVCLEETLEVRRLFAALFYIYTIHWLTTMPFYSPASRRRSQLGEEPYCDFGEVREEDKEEAQEA